MDVVTVVVVSVTVVDVVESTQVSQSTGHRSCNLLPIGSRGDVHNELSAGHVLGSRIPLHRRAVAVVVVVVPVAVVDVVQTPHSAGHKL